MPPTFNKDIIFALVKGFLAQWQLWLFFGVIVLIKFARILWEENRLSKSGICEIDTMDGLTFEKYLEVLFERLGYKVERTQYTGDYGADLITCKDGVKTVIQAKRHKNNIGIKAVQEAVAAKGKYGCTEAMVVTNSRYTHAAIELADANNVKLWDRDDLIKALLSIKKDHPDAENKQNFETVPVQQDIAENDVCAICGARVSEKVKQYCISNPYKFGGKVYCFDHQRNMSDNINT